MYKPSKSAQEIANRASKLVRNYHYEARDPFVAIQTGLADCIGAVLVICAARAPEDPELTIIRHSVMTVSKLTGVATPYEHYIAISNMGDIIDMVSKIEANNRSAYITKNNPMQEASGGLESLYEQAVDLNIENTKVEKEIDIEELGIRRLHRLAFIDAEILQDHVAPGRSMSDLSAAVFRALEDKATSVV